MELSGNAKKVLEKRYLLKDDQGRVVETPEEMLWRVARAVAEAEKASERERWAEEFFKLMDSLRFLPNSPTLMNAGTPIGQLSACFVLPIPDSMEGIFETLKQAAKIHQSGGGTGFAFTRLRPKGDIVRSTKGVASGPVSFMRVYDAATEAVKQGGRRRGANMGILHVWHPDIFEFITCKDQEGAIRNFNISVAATDEFMKAVEENGEIELINPRNKEVVKRVRAREIFDLIVKQAWKNGEPGMIFIDEINRKHPLSPEVGIIESTNPCLTGDTWVVTSEGPRQIREILGKPVRLLLNGRFYDAPDGFFSTGVKPILELKTRRGFTLRLTPDHPVMTPEGWRLAGELKPGDRVKLSADRGARWPGRGTWGEGYLLGLLVGDGTLKRDRAVIAVWEEEGAEAVMAEATAQVGALRHRADFKGFVKVSGRAEWRLRSAPLRDLARFWGLEPGRKTITPEIERGSWEFYRGFLRGLFDADGSVQGSHKKGVSVRLAQSDLDLLRAVQRMLARLGIVSRIYENRRPAGKKLLPDGKGGLKEYPIKAQHELVISGENLALFRELVGFSHARKARRLRELLGSYKRSLNRETYEDEVVSVEPVGEEEVYDVQVPGVNAFSANGLWVHNCGEQPLLPYESCNLGSINLSKFYVPPDPWFIRNERPATWEEVKGDVDWAGLRETVRLATRFLDDVIDVNKFPLPEIEENTKANRKIGLGVMGFADLLYMLGIPYSSEDALRAAEDIMRFITDSAREASYELGLERGSFPNFEKSWWAKDYEAMRNATVTTIAPTGTISMIADCSSGIEPVFSLVYTKNVMEGESLLYVNKYLQLAADKYGFSLDELADARSIKGFAHVPHHIKEIFDTTFDINPEQHVRMQAAFQRYTDNAVSKTINLPNSATEEDVARAFKLAWELKCKGITVYRDGSRTEQVLKAKAKEEKAAVLPGYIKPRPRPAVVTGKTYKVKTELGNTYITINEDAQGPLEVFVHLGKPGSSLAALSEAIGRLISLALRSSVSPKAIIEQLEGIKSVSPTRQPDGTVVFSVPDAIAKTLKKFLEEKAKEKEGGVKVVVSLNGEAEKPEGTLVVLDTKLAEEDAVEQEICPECGGPLIRAEGCFICRDCGYTKCE